MACWLDIACYNCLGEIDAIHNKVLENTLTKNGGLKTENGRKSNKCFTIRQDKTE